jgi:hypothetical protein
VSELFEMALQSAGDALRMIVVRTRQAVVEQQQQPPLEAGTNTSDPGLEPEANLRGVAGRQGLWQFFQ